MLKNLTLNNFVHFLDEQSFRFEDGPNFFIGENRSAKSCAFEAIRRCMSTSKNFFSSSSHDKTNTSVVICEYIDDRNITIFSCNVTVPLGENNGVLKVVVEKSKEVCVHVDVLKENNYGYPVNEQFKQGHGQLAEIFKQNISTEDLLKCINEHIVKTDEFKRILSDPNIGYNSSTDCETYLKENIDCKVVITEPMRSISRVQWTNGVKLDNHERTKNSVTFNNQMQERSEILTWYMDTKYISKVEKEKVDTYFAILTDNSSLKFEKKDNVIQVDDNGNIVSLEKAPEGYLEAKICAILLSIDRFKTVCLEEPGRGTHPQLIERMRDLMLRGIEKKTVILISHIPTFLTSRNVEKLFLFRRTGSVKNGAEFTVVRGKELFDDNENKAQRMITIHVLATIFFARRVLLVKGEYDLLFMSAFKSILLTNDALAQKVVTAVKPTYDQDSFNRFLLSLHVLSLNGEQNKGRLEQVCNALGLERYFILDYDAIIDGSGSTETFFNLVKLKDELKAQFVHEGVTVVEQKRIFVWKKAEQKQDKKRKVGTIEDALICLTEFDKTLKKDLKVNNVNLQWNFQANVRNEHKLFSSKILTDGNIDTVVQAIIKSSLEQTTSDSFRLITFLIQACFSP